LLLDPQRRSLHDLAERKATDEAGRIAGALTQLNSHLLATEPRAIGAYGPAVGALGPAARNALAAPSPEPLLAIQQCRDVFQGANAMAIFVRFNYTN
jgi:hypothetical protein